MKSPWCNSSTRISALLRIWTLYYRTHYSVLVLRSICITSHTLHRSHVAYIFVLIIHSLKTASTDVVYIVVLMVSVGYWHRCAGSYCPEELKEI